MTNDMTAMASNRRKIVSPKCDKKDDLQVWVTCFPHLTAAETENLYTVAIKNPISKLAELHTGRNQQ